MQNIGRLWRNIEIYLKSLPILLAVYGPISCLTLLHRVRGSSAAARLGRGGRAAPTLLGPALLAIDDATLCALLLCLGGGSVFAMQLAGVLGTRLGSKPAITVGGIGLAALLPTRVMA